jgi:DNA repair exonuclease SbcCD ATPase subunit
MRIDDLDQKLQALREAGERISANLLELELDSNRELLERTALDGRSAAVWAPASDALTELWRRQGLLDQLLERAAKLRGSRQADELRSLLEGPSIELARADVPIAERSLLGLSQAAQRCSASDLIASMSSSFDQVNSAVSAIGGAWHALIPKVEAARQGLAEAVTLADSLGEAGRRDLASVATELDGIAARVSTDPLSVEALDLDAVVRKVGAIRTDLDASAELRTLFEQRMSEARERVAQARAALRAAEAAREELLMKIAAPAAPPPLPAADGLEAELAEIAELSGHGLWRDARRSLDGWSTRTDTLLEDARRAAQASRAPIEERNQLRALLEAYQVKAGRLGLLEDPELDGIFTRGHEALYTAPTDLTLAKSLVQSYQRALSDSEHAPEVMG